MKMKKIESSESVWQGLGQTVGPEFWCPQVNKFEQAWWGRGRGQVVAWVGGPRVNKIEQVRSAHMGTPPELTDCQIRLKRPSRNFTFTVVNALTTTSNDRSFELSNY